MTSNKVSATRASGVSIRELLLPAAIGVVLGVLVLGPLLGGGWAWMLDSVSGPHPNFPRTFFGLDGGVIALVPFAVYELGALFGRAIMGWLPFFAVFPIAMVGMYRLVTGTRTARIGAGLFYCLTPVVFDRLWAGHAGFLLGYALLPTVFRSLQRAIDAGGRQWARTGAWIALATACSPHYIWISIILTVGALLVHRPRKELWAGAALAIMVAGLCSAYLLASSQSEGRTFTVGQSDLRAYSSRAIGHEPLLVTLATMRGFWRSDIFQSANTFTARPVLMIVAVLVVILGLSPSRTGASLENPARKNLRCGLGLAISAVIALLLAAGEQGPTGWLFKLAFDHLPGFAIMREPEKFVVVIALALAVAFGNGLARLQQSGNPRFGVAIAAAIAVVIPASISPGIFWAYGNRLGAVHYPDSWTAADRHMGTGDGDILALPWHQYETFPFLKARIVTNPTEDVFRRAVIQGDDVELPNLPTTWNTTRSEYLSYLFARGSQITTFGALVAPLNVKYIVLAKTVDWSTYSWLSSQSDLKAISNSSDLTVFQNTRWTGSSYSVADPIRVKDWGELVGYGEEHGTVAGVLTDSNDQGFIRRPQIDPPPPTVQTGGAVRSNPVKYKLDPAASGDLVVTSEPYNLGWSVAGRRGLESPEGTVMVGNAVRGETLKFRTWTKHLTADIIATVSITITGFVCFRRRRRTTAPQIEATEG